MTKTIRELCLMREIRNLMTWVVDGHHVITPSWIGKSFGFPELTSILEVSDVYPLLEELAVAGIFERFLHDMELICPNCSSSQELRSKYVCPYCGGHNLESGSRMVHTSGTDRKVAEGVMRCRDCQTNINLPKIIHRCYRCRLDYGINKLSLRPVWGYRLQEARRPDVVAHCVLDGAFMDLYRAAGYRVERFGFLKGQSGLSHMFDILACRGDENTAIIIASDPEAVGSQTVVSFYSKKMDVNPKRAILVAMPELSEEARKLADAYGIETVEGRDFQSVLAQFRTRVQTQRFNS